MSLDAVMTTDLITAPPTATVREALRLLEDSDIRHLPVVNDGHLIGIVSDRDLREYRVPLLLEIDHFDEAGRDRANDLLDTRVADVMAADVVSVDNTESITSVLDAMIEYKVGAVPVIDPESEDLVGIVSYIDVLRYARSVL